MILGELKIFIHFFNCTIEKYNFFLNCLKHVLILEITANIADQKHHIFHLQPFW